MGIQNATIGRSKSGIQSLKQDISGDLNKIVSKLKASKYDAVVRAVKANWEGADADDFLKDLKNTTESLKTDINNLKKVIEGILDKEYTEFIKFQQRNVK